MNVSKSLNKALPVLRIVSKLNKRNKRSVLNQLGGEKTVFNALHEIAYNTLNGNLKLKKNQIRKLRPHRKVLENLCLPSSRKCSKRRKKLIIQSGGFLPILIPALTSIITALISRNV